MGKNYLFVFVLFSIIEMLVLITLLVIYKNKKSPKTKSEIGNNAVTKFLIRHQKAKKSSLKKFKKKIIKKKLPKISNVKTKKESIIKSKIPIKQKFEREITAEITLEDEPSFKTQLDEPEEDIQKVKDNKIKLPSIQLAEKKDIDDEEPSQDDEDEDSFVVDYKNDEPSKLDDEDEKDEYLL